MSDPYFDKQPRQSPILANRAVYAICATVVVLGLIGLAAYRPEIVTSLTQWQGEKAPTLVLLILVLSGSGFFFSLMYYSNKD